MMKVNLYLPYALNFDVGSQAVSLRGALSVSNDEVAFMLGKDLPSDVAKCLPSGNDTTQISEPIGLRGVVLEDFGISGRVYRQSHSGSASTTEVDFTLQATARFTSLHDFVLSSALVIENGDTRLAIVVLSSDRYLSLTDFLSSVIRGRNSWGSSVTDQFAFGAGSLYYLNPPPGSSDDYTYSYQPSGLSPVSCTSGFHLAGSFRLFNQFDFLISLAVTSDEFDLVTTSPQRINVFDFISLDSPSLEISSKRSGTHLRVKTTISVLDTPLDATVIADYDTSNHRFIGDVSASIGKVSLPSSGGTSVQSVTLGIRFAWQKASGNDKGLTILDISGLPATDANLIDKFTSILNNARRGGCEQMVSDWFSNLGVTKLKVGLDGSPSRDGGKMDVPLKLTYELLASGDTIASADIPFTAKLSVPGSLHALPGAIWDSIWDSLDSIAEDMLSNQDTYKAIAIEAAKRGGAQAMARFLCRALNEALEELAKALADIAMDMALATLADAALLAGYLIAVALLGVVALVAFFKQLWEDIKDFFTGKDDSKKKEAEDKIRAVREQAEATLSQIDSVISTIRQKIAIRSLRTSLNDSGQPVASLTWMLGDNMNLDSGSRLSCKFRVLSGEAGNPFGAVLSESEQQSFPLTYGWPELPWPGYQMNAAVCSVLTGYTFLNDAGRAALSDAIDNLRDIDDSVASDFADYLQGKLDEYQSYNDHGVHSDWVYAQSDEPNQMTVGRSHIGLNTRISR